MNFLSRKEAKAILAFAEQNWGADLEFLLDEYGFRITSSNDVYIVSRDVEKLDLKLLRVTGVGIYLGEFYQGLRLSVEGAQIIGPHAKKNVIKISDVELDAWFHGEEFSTDETNNGLFILKHNNDFVGCAKVTNGRVFNFLPKSRRMNV